MGMTVDHGLRTAGHFGLLICLCKEKCPADDK